MNFDPKVSIIIPVYNGANYLREAIDSALAQTYKNTEIIIVNDGSNDEGKTETIAKSYKKSVRYFYKKNGGVASALNKGIEKMTGEYFSWLSHDDTYYPNKITKQIEFLAQSNNKNILIFCDCELIDYKSNIIRSHTINKKYLKNIYLTILSTSIGGCSLLIPKVCFENVGIFDEELKTVQDNHLWLRIAKAGYPFKYIPDILLKSRIHPEQGSFVLEELHKKETDNFYLWAFNFIGNQINVFYIDLLYFLLIHGRFNSCKALLKYSQSGNKFYLCYIIFKGIIRFFLYQITGFLKKYIPSNIFKYWIFLKRRLIELSNATHI